MKKTYITPIVTEVTIEAEQMLATSLGTSDETIDTSTPNGQLGSGNRGEWGDLWK